MSLNSLILDLIDLSGFYNLKKNCFNKATSKRFFYANVAFCLEKVTNSELFNIKEYLHLFVYHYIWFEFATFRSSTWPFEDSHDADAALGENEFDTPELEEV